MIIKVTVAFLVVFATVVSYIEAQLHYWIGLPWRNPVNTKITVSMIQ